MSGKSSSQEEDESTSVNSIVRPATEVSGSVQAVPAKGFSECATRPIEPSSVATSFSDPASGTDQCTSDRQCTTEEISCLGCGTMFSHDPPAAVDSQPCCSEECAVKFCERGVGGQATTASKQPSEGQRVSKILDNVMLDVVGDVPNDDPKTKLGRLKRQLQIKMAVPGETENLPMVKKPRLSSSEKDHEETGKEGKDNDLTILQWVPEDRESKRLAELRMKLGSEGMSFQTLREDESPKPKVTAATGVGCFPWKSYVSKARGRCAPPSYFNQWNPPSSNDFRVGMLLEAVDEASGEERKVVLARVCDIVSVRLVLSLVGCRDTHSGQVVIIDSPDIHPIGWSTARKMKLAIPVGVREELLSDFPKFINEQIHNGEWAPPSLFIYAGQVKPREIEVPHNLVSIADTFLAGQQLEVVFDEKSPFRVRVACVERVVNGQVIVHADGEPREERNFKKCSIDSRQLHPVGFCYSKNHRLIVPRGMSSDAFNWIDYLKAKSAKAAPPHLFKKTNYFRPGMRLEAVDPSNPRLICVARIITVKHQKMKIHFDNCDSTRDTWVDADSRSIFPCGWCEKVNHPLEAPVYAVHRTIVQSPSKPSSDNVLPVGDIGYSSPSSVTIEEQPSSAKKDHTPSKKPWNVRDANTGRFLKKSEVEKPTSTVSGSASQTVTTVSNASPKAKKVALITGSSTARKSTSGRLSLPLSPQLALRQHSSKTAASAIPVTVSQSPFRAPCPPAQGDSDQMVLPTHSCSLLTTAAMSSDEASRSYRFFFNISSNINTGSLIGRQKLCFLPNWVEGKSYSELAALTLQSILVCSDHPQAVLRTIPRGKPNSTMPRIQLEQVWNETLSTPLPKCDSETGMFRIIHQVLDAVGCSRDFVSRTRTREGEPSVAFAERVRVPLKGEDSHVAYVDLTATPIGPWLSRDKLMRADIRLEAKTYPELAQKIAQFLVDHSKDPRATYNMIPEAKIAMGKELYVILPDGTKKPIVHQTGYTHVWTTTYRCLQTMRCSPDFLTPKETVSSSSEISKVFDSTSSRKSSQDAYSESLSSEQTTASRPVAYFNTAVESGPHVVPSMLPQLPKEVRGDSYVDLVRRVVQALSAVAVSPNVVFESIGSDGYGDQFSMLWKDEHGQLKTQVVTVEDTHESAWDLICKLLDRLECSPYFVTPRENDSQSAVPESGSATFQATSWPEATFDGRVNPGPMLDVRQLKRLPARLASSTVENLHKRLIQTIIDCALRPEQVFWLVPGGKSSFEVICRMANGDILRRTLRPCLSLSELRRYIESFLINIRCSAKFVRIGYRAENQTVKTSPPKIGTKAKEQQKLPEEYNDRDESSPVEFAESTVEEGPSSTVKPQVPEATDNEKAKSFEEANPESWTVNDVVSYIRSTSDCQELAPVFKKHEIDGSALLLLDRDALVQFMDVKVGPTLKLLRHVNELKRKWTT